VQQRIGIDVGGTNTDAVLMQGQEVVGWVKTLTTADVTSGIVTALQPTFKGSECLCRFLALRTLHTTRSRDRAHHRPTGDKDGHQRAA
jgi:Hydantoinase/oxoprolinase N-terminal region